jgi:hypothetical protein
MEGDPHDADRPCFAWGKALPSSPIICSSGQAPDFGDTMGWLVRRVHVDGLSAGGTEAILSTVPALEDCIAAEAGGLSSISTCGFLTHDGPQ